MNGITKNFVFTVLPFGLSTACSIFTKLLRPLLAKWRGMGIKAILYLDDGIVSENNLHSLHSQVLTIRSDLKKAGFTVNEEKSVWNPAQTLEWLGILINTVEFTFVVPVRKVLCIRQLACRLSKQNRVSARYLARLVGKIISLKYAVGADVLL